GGGGRADPLGCRAHPGRGRRDRPRRRDLPRRPRRADRAALGRTGPRRRRAPDRDRARERRMTRSADAVVVGGGVVGCAVAFALAREGQRVALLERGEIGGEASGAAAGLLLPPGERSEPGPLPTLARARPARFPPLAAPTP